MNDTRRWPHSVESSYLSTLGAYTATFEPSSDVFADIFALADKVGGTVGLTDIGRVVITLTATDDDPRPAIRVAATLTGDDFPHCYVEPGTDTVLTFAFGG